VSGHDLDIGVLDLLRRPGARRHVELEVALSGLGLTSAAVTDTPVQVRIDLEAQGNQIVVMGEVVFEWEGACRRCLEPTGRAEQAELREIFEADPVEGETWPLDVDRIDLEPLVREAVVLGLPLAPLCRPDCPGPDPDHYPASVEESSNAADDGDEAEARSDPRWAALDQLRFD